MYNYICPKILLEKVLFNEVQFLDITNYYPKVAYLSQEHNEYVIRSRNEKYWINKLNLNLNTIKLKIFSQKKLDLLFKYILLMIK